MIEFPPVTIVMTTYFPTLARYDAACVTKSSWERNLRYDGEILLHIADDGSDFEFPEFEGDWHSTHSRQDRQGVGSSLNKGFAKAFEISPLVLYAVDDWALSHEFDITPWVYLLQQREDVGMVRLGPPHPNIKGTFQMMSDNYQGWGIVLDRVNFAFATRPALYHKRFIDAYGWFKEDTSAVEVERIYNEHFCRTPGPNIVYALPQVWEHIGPESLSEIEPNK